MIVIRNGTILTSDGWLVADVAISEGVIAAVGIGLDGDTMIEGHGCLVGPGFVDLHSHLREPGQTWKEDVASGSRAAAAGGFTAVVAMPNTDPPIDSPKVAELVMALGEEVGLVDVVPCGTLTLGRLGSSPADIEALYHSGVRMFSDDGDSLADSELMEEIMMTVAGFEGAMVAQHPEDAARTVGGHMHEGEVSRRIGIGGLPAAAESDVVRRDLDLVRRTRARYHCQHVSSKMTVEMISAAKAEGLPVTAEVTPHHLSFTEEDLDSLDTNFKMYPPLRAESDRVALVAALRDGTIDAVATDHAPHQHDEKRVPFSEAPRGVIGLETAAAVVWETLHERDTLFRVLSTAPAAIAGLAAHGRPLRPGNEANVVVFAPDDTWTASSFRSKSANSPYLGAEMQGRVRATIHQGKITYQSGEK